MSQGDHNRKVTSWESDSQVVVKPKFNAKVRGAQMAVHSYLPSCLTPASSPGTLLIIRHSHTCVTLQSQCHPEHICC